MTTTSEPLLVAAEPAPPRPLLQVRDLSTTFQTPRGPLHAVDGVSFDLQRGEALGLVGESGSGKSVLVRSVMNLLSKNARLAPETQVSFDGKDVRRLPRSDARHFWGPEIAMIFQDPMTSLNPVKKIGLQIGESVRYHLGASRKVARQRALDLLGQVGIPEPRRRLDEYPHQLSGGMRQRVSIAIALACDPKLLIADEPTTALDVTVQRQILDLLAGLQRERSMAMILVTHDLGVVASRADRIAVMYAGRLVETGDTASVFARMRHPYVEALLNSSPRLKYPSHTRLAAISGRPPDMVNPPDGCRFALRCSYAQDLCRTDSPALSAPAWSDHAFACHFPVTAE